MCPRSQQQFNVLREKSRKAILKAALKLYAREGFEATTIADIARESRVSKGLIFHYFRSKDALLLSLMNASLERYLAIVSSISENGDPLSELESFIHRWMTMIKKDKDFLRLGLQLHVSGAFRRIMKNEGEKQYAEFSRSLNEVFRRLGADDPDLETLLLFSVFDGILLNYTAAPHIFPIEKMENGIIQKYRMMKWRIG